MANRERKHISINDTRIPLDIFRERRKSVRISFGKKALLLRLPKVLSSREEQKQINWAIQWANKEISRKPELFIRFSAELFETGDTISILGNSYTFDVVFKDSDRHKVTLQNDRIHLTLAKGETDIQYREIMARFISNLVAKKYKKYVVGRVKYWNDKYFQKDINSIRLKYNKTNWGSCSTKNNINISTRLLLAPKDIVDYVIVHELAHLIEMNHSHRFWAIVERIVPDYKKKVDWLNQHGNKCDFVKITSNSMA